MEEDKAMVKLTSEEITKIATEHARVVEEFAAKFEWHYLDLTVQLKDYRKWLEEMEKHLTRAEELARMLGAQNGNA